jgi:hypothetical protein
MDKNQHALSKYITVFEAYIYCLFLKYSKKVHETRQFPGSLNLHFLKILTHNMGYYKYGI